MANSPLVSFRETNMVMRVKVNDMAAKTNHHKGNCHQFGNSAGEKLTSILEKTIQGRAIFIANWMRNPWTFSGIAFLLATQNPIIPIPRSTTTASNTQRKTSKLPHSTDLVTVLCPYYNNCSNSTIASTFFICII